MFACIEDKWNNKQQEYISKVRQNVPEELMFLHLDGDKSQRIQAPLSILYNHAWHQVEPSILGMTENCVV